MKPIVDIAELQEHHLDVMLKLAFDHMDAKEVQQLVEEPDPELTPQEEEMADEIFLMAMAKADQQEKKEKKQTRSDIVRRVFPKVIQVAAAIVLVFAIATPIAFANSASFRSRVLQLLFQVDEELGRATFEFVEDTDAAFTVPDEWTGDYFPAYFPDGFVFWKINPYMLSAEYRNDEGHQVFFNEFTEDTSGSAGTENSQVTYVELNGSLAQVIDGYDDGIHGVTITWANDTNWFVVATNDVDTEEALKIAESVKRIIK